MVRRRDRKLSPRDLALHSHLEDARGALRAALTLCSRTGLRPTDDYQFVGGPRARDAAAMLRMADRNLEGVGALLMAAEPEPEKERRRPAKAAAEPAYSLTENED